MEWLLSIGTTLLKLSVIIYGLAVLFVSIFGLLQIHLLLLYLLRKQPKKPQKDFVFPKVTIQLPIFNERHVAERLIDQIVKLDYPSHLLEIQVLDDSTDETKKLIAHKVKFYQSEGVDIVHIHRTQRTGYKAGALADALPQAKGEFIAIFDADFLPRPDFLQKLMPRFDNPNIGVIQTRWEHLNENSSILTRVQALLLNIHFVIEQVGRTQGKLFLQFNGTGGIWRKQTIVDAGGWRTDTLTEDLDLSYRAQLKGWQIKYYPDVGAPAELPAEIHGLKSQQYRWMKGGAETAKLLLKPLWNSKHKLSVKIQGTAHLLTSSVFVVILMATIFSVPASYSNYQLPTGIPVVPISILALMGLSINYFIANLNHAQMSGTIGIRFIKLLFFFPIFMALSLGLSLHNAYAVLKGFFGQPSEFVRTPKFGLMGSSNGTQKKDYFKPKLDRTVVLEGVLIVYFGFALIHAFQTNHFGIGIFYAILVLGYSLVFLFSIRGLT